MGAPIEVGPTNELLDLRNAVILATDPEPGFRLNALMVISIWVPNNAEESTEPSHLHTLTWPAAAHSEMIRAAAHVGEFLPEVGGDE